MSITTTIRAWFTKEVIGRIMDIESKLESLLADVTSKESDIKSSIEDFLESAKDTAASLDIDMIKNAVIAEVLVILKAEGVQLTEALLEKYGVAPVVAAPVAEIVVHAVEDALESK